MGRPSVKAKRTEEILQAYEHCIILYGVEGATLQKIAKKAGIARPLLRHHVGNSRDLLKMAVKRFIERSEAFMQDIQDALPNDCSGEDFVKFLFPDIVSKAQYNDTMIAAAFIYVAQINPDIKKQMQAWLKRFMSSFSTQLQKLYPTSDSEKVENVSAGIVSIYFNVESLALLDTNKPLRDQSYQATLYLLKTLNQ